MRKNYALALVTLILAGIGVKLFFFPAAPAEAEAQSGLGVSRMHVGKKLTEKKLHDQTFVFSPHDWP